MQIRRAVVLGLVTWAVIATAAALILAARGRPDPQRAEPPPPKRVRRPLRDVDRDAVMIAQALKMAVDPPAAPEPGAGPVAPVEMRIVDLLEQMIAHGPPDGDWDLKQEQEAWRKINSLLAYEPKAHLALMNRMRTAESIDEVDSILSLLVWTPFAHMRRHRDVTDQIEAAAREILAEDPNPSRRYGAVRVLCRYDRPDRDAVLFGLDRLGKEPDEMVRDTLLEELSVAGRQHGLVLSRKEAEPLVLGLRQRLRDGVHWCATALADWSDDPADFDHLMGLFSVETDWRVREQLVNAVRSDALLTTGREAECRSLLLELVQSPSESSAVRSGARDQLATFGPLDEKTAAAVRSYDEARRRR